MFRNLLLFSENGWSQLVSCYANDLLSCCLLPTLQTQIVAVAPNNYFFRISEESQLVTPHEQMLLYSSQVSVAISSFIAFIFTVALFLSGYILQQKTLRDLRAEIRPQLSRNVYGADLYLPSHVGGENARLEKLQWKLNRGAADRSGEEYINFKHGEERNDDMFGVTRWQKQIKNLEKRNNAAAVRSQKKGLDKKDNLSPTLSRAERRKLIRSQILTEGDGDKPQTYRRRKF
ncbi:hypothetical protein OnM2_073063 [Erysiphe neolycopersici]|uniref:Uncharacterized protein n=1 Tax=Erysiphe neolycopersici TaxID=212602 RepID=A0A420HJ84_9PEZI|nr:hypothetical protein OnM2_073063 [Erysiphe neolycopersici]